MLQARFIFLMIPFLLLALVPAQGRQVPDGAEITWVNDGRNKPLPPALRKSSPAKPFPDAQKEHILEHLLSRGYLSASIDSVSLEPPRIYSGSGCRYRVNRYEFSIDPKGRDLLDEELDYRPAIRTTGRNWYSADMVKREADRIIRYWENLGFMLAEVHVKEIKTEPEDCLATVHLALDTGPRVQAAGQLMSPVRRNNPRYLQRVAGIKARDVITPSVLRNARNNLANTGLFIEVKEPVIVSRPDGYYVFYEFEEARTNSFDLLFGYVPQPSGKNSIIGTGRLDVRNALLSGSALHFSFERLQLLVTKLNASYDVRWIMGTPVGAGFSMNFIQQDSTYQVRNVQFTGRYILSGTTDIIASVRSESTSSQGGPGVPLQAFDGSVLFGGIGIEYRQVNRTRNPDRGFEARLMVESGIRRISDPRAGDFTESLRYGQQEINLFMRAYINPFHRHVIAPSLNGYAMISKEFTVTDLNRFGGARSLRGYREDQFQSSRMLWGDLEYRFQLDRESYAFAFGALGFYERPRLVFEPDDSMRVRDRLSSWGIGIAFNTPLGVMQFSYAISPEDDFTNGKVHFGLQAGL